MGVASLPVHLAHKATPFPFYGQVIRGTALLELVALINHFAGIHQKSQEGGLWQ